MAKLAQSPVRAPPAANAISATKALGRKNLGLLRVSARKRGVDER
jgi:hypothetical protein